MPAGWDDLPVTEFAFPGRLRDKLVAAILDGSKTSTTALLADYVACGDPLPEPGERSVVIDSNGEPVALIETTAVAVVRLADVDRQHVVDEGEGDRTIAEWRAGHERFWASPEVLAELADPTFRVDDDTRVVLQRFVLVETPNG